MRACEHCGQYFNPLTTRARYCSKKCFPARNPRVVVVCSECGKSRLLVGSKAIPGVCRSCAAHKRSGENSPTWRGGHHHWSPGRFGKDLTGLSWKVQRQLAWERDNYTCQHCGQPKKRKPDVHHIDPWKNSHSHALDNLICLCQSCHLKEEAKQSDTWGYTQYTPQSRTPEKPVKKPRTPKKAPIPIKHPCPICGKPARVVYCVLCIKKFICSNYHKMSQSEIATYLGLSQPNICQWFTRLGILVDRVARSNQFRLSERMAELAYAGVD